MTAPLVTVVVPVRDEEATIGETLASIAAQTVGAEALEVLVYDGGSRDATREVAARLAAAAPWAGFDVRANPARIVPWALNDALQRAQGELFLRVDGRASLSGNYVEACRDVVESSGACVAAGGRLAARADGAVAGSIAAAVTHRIGVGRGFRTVHEAGAVPHHPFAVWRTAEMRELGGFDPALARNQDDEFSMRATGHGFRILLEPRAVVRYQPRERFRGLAAQYFQYGLWKSVVVRRGGPFPARSAVPPVVTAAAGAAVAAALSGRSARPAVALGALYAAVGAGVARGHPQARGLLTGLALLTVHAAYGAGVLVGLARPGLAWGRLGSARVR